MLKKGDVILVLLIVFGISLSVIVSNGNNTGTITSWNNTNNKGKEDVFAIVKTDDRIIKTINLTKLKKREVVKVPGQYNEFIVADQKKICFMSADCPDRLCVKAGWISKPGQIAVCLPNRTLIKIVSNNDKTLDGIAK
ncbi:MAG: hypothetical protein K0R50_2303 [Eubacterium sp.]|jgi:hypothetical protein|nr:hypothetical protein [Eubacterium sp.]